MHDDVQWNISTKIHGMRNHLNTGIQPALHIAINHHLICVVKVKLGSRPFEFSCHQLCKASTIFSVGIFISVHHFNFIVWMDDAGHIEMANDTKPCITIVYVLYYNLNLSKTKNKSRLWSGKTISRRLHNQSLQSIRIPQYRMNCGQHGGQISNISRKKNNPRRNCR